MWNRHMEVIFAHLFGYLLVINDNKYFLDNPAVVDLCLKHGYSATDDDYNKSSY